MTYYGKKNSLHRSKNVPALNETRFRTRAQKSFNPEAVLDRMLELLSDNETNFQRYADVIKQDGLEKVKEYIGKGNSRQGPSSLYRRVLV